LIEEKRKEKRVKAKKGERVGPVCRFEGTFQPADLLFSPQSIPDVNNVINISESVTNWKALSFKRQWYGFLSHRTEILAFHSLFKNQN
jgi:hypothetical protein